MLTVALLLVSNIFMTLAWYGQLKFPAWSIVTAIQLKIIQEVITLVVFAVFAVVVLKEPLSWRYAGAFACIVGAAAFMFAGRG
jgi:uncharacterized protein